MIHSFRKEAPMILDQFWLTDVQFSKIAPHLPTGTRGKPRVEDRRVISGIVHVLKSGGRWIDAPPEYGPRKTLYNRYVRWAARGVWVDLFHRLEDFENGLTPAQALDANDGTPQRFVS
jgi:transposase